MNSLSLQKTFPAAYKDFFSQNDLVTSGCFSFSWGSIIGERSNNIIVRSKVPLKVFVGMREKKGGEIEFKNLRFFHADSSDFSTHSILELWMDEEKVMEIIREFLQENAHASGLEINALSEVPRGHSFGFAGTFFATLATGLFLFVWRVSLRELRDYGQFMNSPTFREIFLLARKLESVAKYGNTIGQNSIHALRNTPYPSYFYAEKGNPSSNPDSAYSRFVDIVEQHENTVVSKDIPADYCVVYSGVSTSTKAVEAHNRVRGNDVFQYAEFIRNEILEPAGDDKDLYVRKFVTNERAILEAYDDAIALQWIKTIATFVNLLEKGHNEHAIEDFIENVNQYRKIIALIEKEGDFSEDFIFSFRKHRSHPNEKLGILPICSGKMGGGYLIVLKPGISRETFKNAMEEMKNFYPNVGVEYCSYIDGTCSDGILVEQFVSKGIFSPYVQTDKVLFQNNLWETYLENHKAILAKEKNGLLIDMVTNKLFLNGERLTSKEIPSQSATAEILNLLFDRMGEDVSNEALPASGYSGNKNEMLGKIVLPLINLLEKQMDERFPLVCKGEVTNFSIRLDPTGFPLGIIRKI